VIEAKELGLARRTLDIALTVPAMLVLAPLLLVLAVLIKFVDGGPVMFRQLRVGEGGTPFTLYKFRSMRSEAPGPEVTTKVDSRVTPLGRFLRRTSLDELPQLFNVLRGDMTLVGPRPETVALAERYPESCRWVFAYRPGLTGPTQVRFRDGAMLDDAQCDLERYYLETLVPQRVSCDSSYLANPSITATVGIIWATFRYLLGTPAT
jgi:lipopolysaccharide/colanic/teichoic acid biosynthesis glycosyltransferase